MVRQHDINLGVVSLRHIYDVTCYLKSGFLRQNFYFDNNMLTSLICYWLKIHNDFRIIKKIEFDALVKKKMYYTTT